jgi:hypothetical protein
MEKGGFVVAKGGFREGSGRKKKDASQLYVPKYIKFRPDYAELIDGLCAERKISQRELIEEALENTFGSLKKK